MTKSPDLGAFRWPREALAECLSTLLHAARLAPNSTIDSSPVPDDSRLDDWIHESALRLECESETLACSPSLLEAELNDCGPAILSLNNDFLAVLSADRERIRLLSPDGRTVSITAGAVVDQLRGAPDASTADLGQLLARCGLREERRRRAAALMSADRMKRQPVRYGWIFRPATATSLRQWFRQVSTVRNSSLLIISHSAAYVFWLLSWALIGDLSLSGHMDPGWLLGWSLLLATYIACRVLGTWYQGRIAIGVAGLLKRRLLAGILKLETEHLRRRGIGSFLGQTFEAEAIETLALSGGVAGLLATVDLLLSGFVLGRAAILLAAWFAVTCILSWRFLVRYEQWTGNRLSLTQDLVECMVGQRTRLAQQPSSEWHEAEDRALEGYFGYSKAIDKTGAILLAIIPRGWLIASLAYFATTIVPGKAASSQSAILLGGILLAWSAFERIVAASSEITAAVVAWKRIGHLFRAASRPEVHGTAFTADPAGSTTTTTLLEADRLTFRYGMNRAPLLDGCGLTIRQSDRILLEGPSGGGKSTLAALLSGVRQPDSGLILAGGLDMQTLGREGWRKYVVLVPQFHENYILTETLAFNVLSARRWPATPADMAEAEEICRGLGLGDLLDRMPAGLLQMVGEGGWQLSHGERSRIFVARALLQNPALIILDESFGALDPENLRASVDFTVERANSLMVIAHP